LDGKKVARKTSDAFNASNFQKCFASCDLREEDAYYEYGGFYPDSWRRRFDERVFY
jgi:hypothetical protein